GRWISSVAQWLPPDSASNTQRESIPDPRRRMPDLASLHRRPAIGRRRFVNGGWPSNSIPPISTRSTISRRPSSAMGETKRRGPIWSNSFGPRRRRFMRATFERFRHFSRTAPNRAFHLTIVSFYRQYITKPAGHEEHNTAVKDAVRDPVGRNVRPRRA